MLETVHCDDPKCSAYKTPVLFSSVMLRGSRACAVCGQQMVDGARSNDNDLKSGRKHVIGKSLVVRGKRQPTRFKTKRKISGTKRGGYKR